MHSDVWMGTIVRRDKVVRTLDEHSVIHTNHDGSVMSNPPDGRNNNNGTDQLTYSTKYVILCSLLGTSAAQDHYGRRCS